MAKIDIESEVSGNVWKVEKQVGDRLEQDDVIMILESMKMEIEVIAPEAGRVSKLCRQQGQQVSPGQPLLIIEQE